MNLPQNPKNISFIWPLTVEDVGGTIHKHWSLLLLNQTKKSRRTWKSVPNFRFDLKV